MSAIRQLRDRLNEQLQQITTSLLGELGAEVSHGPAASWGIPSDPSFGDLSTPIAFSLAKVAKRPPRLLGEELAARLDVSPDSVERVEVAGAGYINLHLNPDWWRRGLLEILRQQEKYGQSNLGGGRSALVEFVSANPTGPLHVGHGRGAAVGDAVANLLSSIGFEVKREYYINDAGTQMEILGKSVWARYQELLGIDAPFPENGYRGGYIRDLASEVMKEKGRGLLDLPAEEGTKFCGRFAKDRVLQSIEDDLRQFGVRFDDWFSETSLYERDAIRKSIGELEEMGLVYRKEGALWFSSASFGDDKDRVLIRETGEPTYFASDVAYHVDKYHRGFSLLIDIWGADHHGYIPRLKALVKALGHDPDSFQVLLVQLVNLLRASKPVAMSTRAGEFVTLQEVIAEVGADAARYIFLTRRCDSHLDFDLEVAKAQSMENPVYYVQYAHARLCSVLREAVKSGFDLATLEPDLSLLSQDEELHIIKSLVLYPEILLNSALAYEPHRMTAYLQDLAARIHSYYNKYRFITEDRALSDARLYLAQAILIVLRQALSLLGVAAPERM
jgi:arginyl-tRNA synthetase